MAHHDLRRENSASRSRESHEQYFIDELQAHLLEEANAATQIASAGILSKLYTSGGRRSHGKAACLVYRAFKVDSRSGRASITFMIALLTIIIWGVSGTAVWL
jgi:hypothetical protein